MCVLTARKTLFSQNVRIIIFQLRRLLCVCKCPLEALMRTHDVLSFVWWLASTGFIAGSNAQYTAFRPVTAANGSTMCAVFTPTSTMSVHAFVGLTPGVPHVVGCAFLCTRLNASGTVCSAVNYVNTGTIVNQGQF